MAERHSGEWHRLKRAALEEVQQAEVAGYKPTAIGAAMAGGNFGLTEDGRLGVSFGSSPPTDYPTASSAPLFRMAEQVHGLPRLEDTEPNPSLTAAQRAKIEAEIAQAEAARAAAEKDIARSRAMGRDCIKGLDES